MSTCCNAEYELVIGRDYQGRIPSIKVGGVSPDVSWPFALSWSLYDSNDSLIGSDTNGELNPTTFDVTFTIRASKFATQQPLQPDTEKEGRIDVRIQFTIGADIINGSFGGDVKFRNPTNSAK